ncbi:hypothetical protein ACMZOO_12785 [Catenovulum sp. SX2]|uniref:hypothetical protein n=1 Tax=Catenovulum sp. SX2 TaxID=3398614 RepID=UPI003F8572B3
MRVEYATAFHEKAHAKVIIYSVGGVLLAALFTYIFNQTGLFDTNWAILGAIFIISLFLSGFFLGCLASKNDFECVFKCKQCDEPIAKPLETNGSDLPILYMCSKCEILWFTGDNS